MMMMMMMMMDDGEMKLSIVSISDPYFEGLGCDGKTSLPGEITTDGVHLPQSPCAKKSPHVHDLQARL